MEKVGGSEGAALFIIFLFLAQESQCRIEKIHSAQLFFSEGLLFCSLLNEAQVDSQ